MNRPILIAALVEDRRHRFPYGTVTQQPYGLCRECEVVVVWQRETARSNRRTASHARFARTRKAGLFMWVASLLQTIGKGAES
jgi:hypothetical protein